MTLTGSDTHFDRGDGVCVECFEEWPCLVVEGKRRTAALHDEHFAYYRERREREVANRQAMGEVVQEMFNSFGFKYRIDKGWVPIAMNVDLDDLYQIALALREQTE